MSNKKPPINKTEARKILQAYLNEVYGVLPIYDAVIISGKKNGVHFEYTFRYLIKIAYEL